MRITKDEARRRLRACGLRVTAPRVAVLGILADAEGPVSFTQVLDLLGDSDWDQATIYRNLVKLRGAGLAPVVSRMDGIDRYALRGRPRRRPSPPALPVRGLRPGGLSG